jgi:hypothetical protein
MLSRRAEDNRAEGATPDVSFGVFLFFFLFFLKKKQQNNKTTKTNKNKQKQTTTKQGPCKAHVIKGKIERFENSPRNGALALRKNKKNAKK